MPAASSQLKRSRSATAAIAACCIQSIAKASNNAVNRDFSSAHGARTWRIPWVGQLSRGTRACTNERPVLTRVQVAPLALAMIVDRRARQAVGTDPPRVGRQRDPDVHLTVPLTQLYLLDPPRVREAQNRGIQALVVHVGSSPGPAPAGRIPPRSERTSISPHSCSHPNAGSASMKKTGRRSSLFSFLCGSSETICNRAIHGLQPGAFFTADLVAGCRWPARRLSQVEYT